METTFISIHDLSENAIILYTSESVIDILGYTPDQIVSRSIWEFFPPDEVPYAKTFRKQRVDADKAAVLAYCRIKNWEGQWVSCECCFTVVYDVMVVCTSIYSRGLKSDRRSTEAPLVRRVFASSPNDPRYHMLSHISSKFSQSARTHLHEPRAALFLNRFTRTLTIMYATRGLEEVIGIPAETMRGRSFYFIISENCLQDAVKCLENAKANDSIAYLRFWFRDPRIDDSPDTSDDSDAEMTGIGESDDDSGVRTAFPSEAISPDRSESSSSNVFRPSSSMEADDGERHDNSRNSSGDSTHPADTHEAIFGSDPGDRSSSSSSTASPEKTNLPSIPTVPAQLELEAVISCASDGLVVCLRRARPSIPGLAPSPLPVAQRQGVFAAPWATQAFLPPPRANLSAGSAPNPHPPLVPPLSRRDSPASLQSVHRSGQDDFMSAIRDQAIFAWALVGINGSIAHYGKGKPQGEALPAKGNLMRKSDSDNPGRPGQVSDGKTSTWDVFRNKLFGPFGARTNSWIPGDPDSYPRKRHRS